MAQFLVSRTYNHHGDTDYLSGFDVIWGPIWVGCRGSALLMTEAKAEAALSDAIAIMRPRPFCVPDLGARFLTLSVDAT